MGTAIPAMGGELAMPLMEAGEGVCSSKVELSGRGAPVGSVDVYLGIGKMPECENG